ncbi:amidohydrolase family protein [Aureibaculum sp. A20]|uniref:Amidohydrolase family protein n=1 Tax=Aureibaculum flavum TaxID=2795986 RepID=A0ABS0WRM2_9FLAO|nr:amidohydrolase family protein [Aureibaculum flavum]MBJ2174613.1 amidohydrolase family protein [Aureibaculum flavum]
MKIIKNIVASLLFVFTIQLTAQQTPADKQSEVITIVGATAHIGNGEIIENSVITFENGKITAIDNAATTNTSGKIIDAKGKHVYPGFIMPNSTLGLGEIDAVKASVDQSEIGGVIPHVRSLIAYNAESKVVESMRPNGVLLAQITPRGGRISGTSSVVQLDAWNWEDAAVKVDDGIHLNWPNSFSNGRRRFGEEPGIKPNKDYGKQVEEIKQFLVGAKTYKLSSESTKNLPFEASLGLFDGAKKLYIHADNAREIIDAVTFSKEMGVKNVVIVGGYEANKTIDILKKHSIPVLVQRTQSLPNHNDDNYDFPYKLPKLLTDAGILVGLENSGSMERMNSRNLPFYAGQVVGQGLDKEKALQLITGNTAKILGIDKDYGTLEVGKSATLFISEGDALDMRTNQLSHAYIDGRLLSLETHQTELWKRYSNKYSK